MNQVPDLNLEPKAFCDNVHLGFSEGLFVFTLSSGVKNTTFVVTPLLFKVMVKMFNDNLSIYEGKFGVIDTSKNNIISPIQKGDLGKKK